MNNDLFVADIFGAFLFGIVFTFTDDFDDIYITQRGFSCDATFSKVSSESLLWAFVWCLTFIHIYSDECLLVFSEVCFAAF